MKLKIILLLIPIASTLSFGQTKSEESKAIWSFEDCVNYALENNITVKDAELTKSSSEIQLMKSRSMRLPNLSGSASQSLTNGTSIDPITSEYITDQIYSTSVGLNTQVTLFQGNQINNQVAQSQLQVEQNMFNLEEAKNNIILSLSEAYIRVLYNKDGIEIAENNYEASKKEAERAKARYEAGSLSIKDYADAESQAATNQYNVITAKNTYAQQLLTLKQLLELGPEVEFDIEEVAPENIGLNVIPSKLEIYELAINNMPEVRASNLNISISEKDLDLAKGSYWPTLSLSGSLGSGYTSTQDLAFAQQFDVNFNQRVGLSLSIPILNRNSTKAEIQTARVNIEKAQLQQVNTEKELYKSVETAWQNAVSAKEQLESAKVARDAAKASHELSQKQFDLGDLSAIDLVISQNTYTNAEQNYLQAKYLYILYSQLIRFYSGLDIKF